MWLDTFTDLFWIHFSLYKVGFTELFKSDNKMRTWFHKVLVLLLTLSAASAELSYWMNTIFILPLSHQKHVKILKSVCESSFLVAFSFPILFTGWRGKSLNELRLWKGQISPVLSFHGHLGKFSRLSAAHWALLNKFQEQDIAGNDPPYIVILRMRSGKDYWY